MSRSVILKVIWCLFILCGLNMTSLMAEAWNVQPATGGKKAYKAVLSFLCGCASQLYTWQTLSSTNAVRTTELESDLMDHRLVFGEKQQGDCEKRGRTGPAQHCNISRNLLLSVAEIQWLTKYGNNKEDWLAGGFRHKFFWTGKSNSRLNNWLNFIWSLTLSILCKILFRGDVT